MKIMIEGDNVHSCGFYSILLKLGYNVNVINYNYMKICQLQL